MDKRQYPLHFAKVIFEPTFSVKAFKQPIEREALANLAKFLGC